MDITMENFAAVALDNAELITTALSSMVQDCRDTAAEFPEDSNTRALFNGHAENWNKVLLAFSDAYEGIDF